jgi:hypothetical protein
LLRYAEGLKASKKVRSKKKDETTQAVFPFCVDDECLTVRIREHIH